MSKSIHCGLVYGVDIENINKEHLSEKYLKDNPNFTFDSDGFLEYDHVEDFLDFGFEFDFETYGQYDDHWFYGFSIEEEGVIQNVSDLIKQIEAVLKSVDEKSKHMFKNKTLFELRLIEKVF